jgi:flavin reductase (DIM6/NTAB) family NADH-FMN oxidoreductase RutF
MTNDPGEQQADDQDDVVDAGDAATYERLVGSVDQPMLVLTASDGAERSGCLVGFATQASIRPPRHLVMISKENHTYPIAVAAPAVVVHVLRSSDGPIAEHFGALTGDEVDKFDGLEVVEGPARAPVLVGLDWFAGRVLRTVDCGDHVALLLAPHDGDATRADEPQLGIRAADRIEPGHPA